MDKLAAIKISAAAVAIIGAVYKSFMVALAGSVVRVVVIRGNSSVLV